MSDDNSEGSDKRFTMLHLFESLFAWRRQVLKIVGAMTGLGLIVALLLPNWYFSYATVRSSSLQRSGLSSLMGSLGSIDQLIGGLSDFGMSTGISDVKTYVKILESRRIMKDVVTHFSLMEDYDSKYLDDAVKEFRGNTEFKTEVETGVLTIGVYDKSPARAAAMAEYLVEMLDKVNIELNTTRARNTREFIERRYSENERDLATAEDSLKEFQRIHGVYLLEEQARTAIEIVAQLSGSLTMKEIQLGLLETRLDPGQAEVLRTRDEIREIKKKISEMYYGLEKKKGAMNEPRVFVPLSTAPDVGLQYLRSFRDVKVKEKLSEILLPLYEKAKIEERQDTPTLMILDRPAVPERKASPKRMFIVLGAGLFGLICALTYVLAGERFRTLRTQRPDDYARIQNLSGEMRGELKKLLALRFRRSSNKGM